MASRITQLNPNQAGREKSPWTVKARIGMLLWRIAYVLLFRPSPRFCKGWRILLLRWFGAEMHGRPNVLPSAIIRIPWHLVMEDGACIGENAEIYNLGKVTLKARCVVAQHCYLCAGTHDLDDPAYPLLVGPIVVGEDVFIGAKALLLPGIVIGDGAVVGAGSVVTKDLPPWTICAGNPAKPIRPRKQLTPVQS